MSGTSVVAGSGRYHASQVGADAYAECVRDTIAQLRTVAALHAVDVVVKSTDDSRVPLAADDCAIVIENLLMNALQHSPRDAKVYLNLRSENATVELTVADQGEGIDPRSAAHLRPFLPRRSLPRALHRRRRPGASPSAKRRLNEPAAPSS